MDKISVIIRNRDEAEHIGYAIQSCIDHFDKPEIIIMDNLSKDDSLEVVNLFTDRTTIKIHTISDYTPGRSLNNAAKLCSNDTILILSAHCQITKMNLQSVKENLKTYKAIFGKQTPIFRGKKIGKRYIWSHFIDKETVNMYSTIEDRYFFHNAFSFFDREFLINNPMPEDVPGKEDRFWAKDIVDRGLSYLYDPLLEVNHFFTNKGATWHGLG
jgi:glycosyltransferase involved in cell wall biosynthesis